MNRKKSHKNEPIKIMHNTVLFKNNLYTKNLIPGKSVYGEKRLKIFNEEYRLWNAKKSKIAAAIKKGLEITFFPEQKVLYLGAASGTTVSHISDILTEGKIFAVEISARVLAKLVLLAENRKNIFPILANANNPLEYCNICPLVDVLFQDIAQKNQIETFIKNARIYLKNNGIAMLSLKIRSIDVSKTPRQIHEITLTQLKEYFNEIRFVSLDPYEKDHYFYLCKSPKFITK